MAAPTLLEALQNPRLPLFASMPTWIFDADEMPAGLFHVTDSTKLPTTAGYLVISLRSQNPAAADVQLAILGTTGAAQLRYRTTAGWQAWAAFGAGGGDPEAADVEFTSAPFFDAALATDPVFDALATALGMNPPLNAQDAITVLAYYASFSINTINGQRAYLLGSSIPNLAVDHDTNPQTIVATSYSINLVADGDGANAHNVCLGAASLLGQRIELSFTFNAGGESFVLKPQGAASGLMDVGDTDITTVTIANAANKQLLLEWVQSAKKWRLLDHSFAGVVIV